MFAGYVILEHFYSLANDESTSYSAKNYCEILAVLHFAQIKRLVKYYKVKNNEQLYWNIMYLFHCTSIERKKENDRQ